MNTRNREYEPRIIHNFRANDRVVLSAYAPPAHFERFGGQTGKVISVTPERIHVVWPGFRAFVSYTERQLDFGQQ